MKKVENPVEPRGPVPLPGGLVMGVTDWPSPCPYHRTRDYSASMVDSTLENTKSPGFTGLGSGGYGLTDVFDSYGRRTRRLGK